MIVNSMILLEENYLATAGWDKAIKFWVSYAHCNLHNRHGMLYFFNIIICFMAGI